MTHGTAVFDHDAPGPDTGVTEPSPGARTLRVKPPARSQLGHVSACRRRDISLAGSFRLRRCRAHPSTRRLAMSFMDAVRSCIAQYVGFSGRARRSEFWYWFLFTIILSVVASVLQRALTSTSSGVITGILRAGHHPARRSRSARAACTTRAAAAGGSSSASSRSSAPSSSSSSTCRTATATTSTARRPRASARHTPPRTSDVARGRAGPGRGPARPLRPSDGSGRQRLRHVGHPLRHDRGDPVTAHRHAVERVGDLHRLLLVRDDDELAGVAQLLHAAR